MTKLNKAVKREIHPKATVEASLAKVKETIFSKLDTNSGFCTKTSSYYFGNICKLTYYCPDLMGNILLQ